MKIITKKEFQQHITTTISNKTGKKLSPATQKQYQSCYDRLTKQGLFNVENKQALIGAINKELYKNPENTRIKQATLVHCIETISKSPEEEKKLRSELILTKKHRKTALTDKATMDQKYLTERQVTAFINAITDDKLMAATLFMIDTGCRRAELLGVTTKDIAPDGSVSVLGKGGKTRTVYLSANTRAYLQQYISAAGLKPDDHLIRYGGVQEENQGKALWLRIKQAGERAGIPNAHPHRWRHTAAVRMVVAGLDIKKISKYLGHTSVVTTEIYAQYDEKAVEKAVRERYFGE